MEVRSIDIIVPAAAIDRVVSEATIETVVAEAANQEIVARTSIQIVIRGSAVRNVAQRFLAGQGEVHEELRVLGKRLVCFAELSKLDVDGHGFRRGIAINEIAVAHTDRAGAARRAVIVVVPGAICAFTIEKFDEGVQIVGRAERSECGVDIDRQRFAGIDGDRKPRGGTGCHVDIGSRVGNAVVRNERVLAQSIGVPQRRIVERERGFEAGAVFLDDVVEIAQDDVVAIPAENRIICAQPIEDDVALAGASGRIFGTDTHVSTPEFTTRWRCFIQSLEIGRPGVLDGPHNCAASELALLPFTVQSRPKQGDKQVRPDPGYDH